MTVVIRSTLNDIEVWANSGSPEDIQAAVDAVAAAGGGTVYVPSGTFYWNNETVTIPGGVNVIGAGAGCKGHENNWEIYSAATILHNKRPPTNLMFYIDGSNGKPVRISGIQFEVEGPIGDDEAGADGIVAENCINLRVDHCTFINFTGTAVLLTNTHTGDASGVIDHCVVDNPYKLGSGNWNWGYGFYVQGRHYWWTDQSAPLLSFLGKYPVMTGHPVLYVEDCRISRCRHAVDAIQGGWIVARYNYIDHPYPTNYGQLEVHGNSGGSWSSARGFEFYNNTVVGETGKYAELTWLRGGAGVVFGNTFQMSNGYAIGLYREYYSGAPDETLHNLWIWNNPVSGGSLINNAGGFTENVDYFLRAPNQQQDGFTYTPYPYPHPLAAAEIPYKTPWTGALNEGTYRITMPQQFQVGTDVYNFVRWEDGSTNPVRTINLTSDMTITATYQKAAPVTHTLTIIARAGGTTNPPPGSYTLSEGTQQIVTAIPGTNYRFVNWLLDGTVRTENPITVTMDKDHTLEAVFEYVSPPPLTATISGVVKDTKGNPIPGATVTCNGYADVTETDGTYIIADIPAKRYTLTVTKEGYQTQTISVDLSAGGTFTQDIILTPVAAPTPPTRITGPLGIWTFPILSLIREWINKLLRRG